VQEIYINRESMNNIILKYCEENVLLLIGCISLIGNWILSYYNVILGVIALMVAIASFFVNMVTLKNKRREEIEKRKEESVLFLIEKEKIELEIKELKSKNK